MQTFSRNEPFTQMIITLSIFDKSDLTRGNICGYYSQAGSRSTLVIAASDGCKENRENLKKMWAKLKVWEIKRKLILSMDGKLGNMAMGKQIFYFFILTFLFFSFPAVGPHSSMQPCLYCTGHKVTADGRRTNQCAHTWALGRRRSPRLVRDTNSALQDKAREKGWSDKRKKKERINYDSVIGDPLQLPEGTDDIPLLFIIPPDPLHYVKLGR